MENEEIVDKRFVIEEMVSDANTLKVLCYNCCTAVFIKVASANNKTETECRVAEQQYLLAIYSIMLKYAEQNLMKNFFIDIENTDNILSGLHKNYIIKSVDYSSLKQSLIREMNLLQFVVEFLMKKSDTKALCDKVFLEAWHEKDAKLFDIANTVHSNLIIYNAKNAEPIKCKHQDHSLNELYLYRESEKGRYALTLTLKQSLVCFLHVMHSNEYFKPSIKILNECKVFLIDPSTEKKEPWNIESSTVIEKKQVKQFISSPNLNISEYNKKCCKHSSVQLNATCLCIQCNKWVCPYCKDDHLHLGAHSVIQIVKQRYFANSRKETTNIKRQLNDQIQNYYSKLKEKVDDRYNKCKQMLESMKTSKMPLQFTKSLHEGIKNRIPADQISSVLNLNINKTFTQNIPSNNSTSDTRANAMLRQYIAHLINIPKKIEDAAKISIHINEN